MTEVHEETAKEHCERVYPEMMAEFKKIQNEMYETCNIDFDFYICISYN